MAARKPHEAVENYLAPLRKAFSCLTKAGLQVTSFRELYKIHALTLNGGDAIRLRGRTDFTLDVAQNYVIERAEGDRGPYTVRTASYAYAIGDADEREILAYHRHPSGQSHIVEPHLHFGPAAGIGIEELVKAYIPTGHITVEGVIRLLIRDFQIKPLRTDWESVLAETERDSASTES